MKKTILLLLSLLLPLTPASAGDNGFNVTPKREILTENGITMQSDETARWMTDGKIGMFIHWGLYAGPGEGEWYMENHGMLPEDYRKLAFPQSGDEYFSAKDFNPADWASLAKAMGARWMCMTTEHHDGYALFDSRYPNAFTSMQTHGRDFIREYVDACRAAGLKVGFYKTLIDWRYPGYYDVTGEKCAKNNFGYVTAPFHKRNARVMKEELYCQTRELMSNYGKIDLIFWDGGWLAQQGTDADGAYFWESGRYTSDDNAWPVDPQYQECDADGRKLALMGMVRKLQPDVLVNGRSGWRGDYGDEEGLAETRGGIRSGIVEKCFPLTSGWGFTKDEVNPDKIVSLKRLQRYLSDCIIRNMCCMINVGPDRFGVIPKAVVDRLTDLGKWVKSLAPAIYGTTGGPWDPVDGKYGFCFKGSTIYVWLLDGFDGSTLTLPAMDGKFRALKAYQVDNGRKVSIARTGNKLTLKNLNHTPGEISVIAVELDRPLK